MIRYLHITDIPLGRSAINDVIEMITFLEGTQDVDDDMVRNLQGTAWTEEAGSLNLWYKLEDGETVDMTKVLSEGEEDRYWNWVGQENAPSPDLYPITFKLMLEVMDSEHPEDYFTNLGFSIKDIYD